MAQYFYNETWHRSQEPTTLENSRETCVWSGPDEAAYCYVHDTKRDARKTQIFGSTEQIAPILSHSVPAGLLFIRNETATLSEL